MITITLDSSQITIFSKCEEKWNLAGRQGLILSGIERPALNNGTVMHKLLELYYNARFKLSPYDAAMEAIVQFIAHPDAQLVDDKARLFLIQRFRDYVIFYNTNDFEPIKQDSIPSIELGFSHLFYEDKDRRYILEGKIDLLTLSRGRGELVFIDHKTQARDLRLYAYTPQFLTYALVTKAKHAIQNIIGLQKEVDKGTFKRNPITFAPHQIEAWSRYVRNCFDEIYDTLVLNVPFKKNYGECGGVYNSSPCQFTHLCELNPENKEIYENLKKFKYEKSTWTPWEVS